ncbi:MAG: phosphate acyltransferase PlsX [Verrucomicrobia bacterium]|nr:phosphate acyltransferase PlsX [Verrucomicrobiota bacterium]
MRIALDVMGGDHGPAVVVRGARLALEANPRLSEVILVGREEEVSRALAATGGPGSRVRIVNASEVLSMEDKPVDALRRKKDCSIARAVELVRDGLADAVISPGNTGGILSAGTLRLRTLAGVSRAAIATVIPAPESDFVLLDAGANVECKPWHLAEFAIMGSVYMREIGGCKSPRVGILSNGTEDNKGTELTQAALRICRKLDLNFAGHIEGHDLFSNKFDVVVTDGFTGNIVLKTCESMAKGIFAWLKRELMLNPRRKLGALLGRNAFLAIKRRLDSENHGGAPMLGLNGLVFKAHASSREQAILNALRVACDAIEHNVNGAILREMAAAHGALEEARHDAQTSGQPVNA